MKILPKVLLYVYIHKFKFMLNRGHIYLIGILFFSILSSCKEEIPPIQFLRFDQDLFDPSTVNREEHYKKLQGKYGDFFTSFAQEMLNISEEERSQFYQPSMSLFVKYPTIVQLKKEVDSVFQSTKDIESELQGAMQIFHDKFKDEKIPCFITFISEFGYANITMDTVVGIGLDMYLGNKYPIYPALEFPDFMIAKLRKEYLVANTIKAFAIGKYENQLTDKRFLAMMLFEGKVRFMMKELLPNVSDTLIFACSQEQLNWGKQNEGMIWKHLVQNKMLFNVEPNQYMRYFNDGPFTIATGVPQESMPAMGVFCGYKIIEKYMKENPSITLQELMANSNWDGLLKNSYYKPE